MTTIAGSYNTFNNLLYQTKRFEISNILEHRAGHTPLDLRYKGESPVNEILLSGASQINGKHGDLKYLPIEIHSRPYYNTNNARIDPTLLDAVRNKYVDVSGLLIPNRNLPKKYNVNATHQGLKSYGIIN